jgi:hypothetical protein
VMILNARGQFAAGRHWERGRQWHSFKKGTHSFKKRSHSFKAALHSLKKSQRSARPLAVLWVFFCPSSFSS